MRFKMMFSGVNSTWAGGFSMFRVIAGLILAVGLVAAGVTFAVIELTDDGPKDSGSVRDTAGNGDAVDIEEVLGRRPEDPASEPASFSAALTDAPAAAEDLAAQQPEDGMLERLSHGTNMTGPVVPGEGNCEDSRIWITPPNVSPSVQDYSRNNTLVIGGSQWVAFKAHLARWDGAQWVDIASQAWKAKEVALQGDPAINSYFDLDTGAWGTGGGPFAITQNGYYAIFFEYYWYGNDYVSAGYTSDWGFLREFRYGAYNLGALGYCQYPAF